MRVIFWQVFLLPESPLRSRADLECGGLHSGPIKLPSVCALLRIKIFFGEKTVYTCQAKFGCEFGSDSNGDLNSDLQATYEKYPRFLLFFCCDFTAIWHRFNLLPRAQAVHRLRTVASAGACHLSIIFPCASPLSRSSLMKIARKSPVCKGD